MTINYQTDDISLTLLQKDFKGYSRDSLRKDLFAALNVALLTIPQAMAYALLAGLPIACGLFASIFAAIIAPAFGSSRHLIVGPSNAIAILVQAATGEVMFNYYRHLTGVEWDMMAVQVLTQLVFLTASMQILAALCKLGRLIQFVSHSVIVGYITGTTIAIVINQLYTLVGLHREGGVHSLYERGAYFMTHVQLAHLPSAVVGGGCMILILLLKRIDKRIPAGVITFAIAAFTVYMFDLASYGTEFLPADPYSEEILPHVMLVGETGGLMHLVPHFGWPYFDTGIMNELLPMAFALALLSVMETTSAAKSIAASSGQHLSVNQEIFGIGLGNLTSAVVGGLPISGSPMRSAVNYRSGAQTRLAAIYNAFFVGLLIYLGADLIGTIPLSSLAALLIVSAASIVNAKQFFLCIKATSHDALVLWVTLLSCIFFSIDIAFYIGVVISIIFYLKKAAIPQLVEYDIDEQGELVNLSFCSNPEHKQIRVIKVEGELFFGAADLFQTTLKTITEDDTSTKVIILQLKNTRDIDATACLALHQLHDYLTASGRHLILCGLMPNIWEVLSDADIVEVIGKENMFLFDERFPQHHMQKAIQRAKQICNTSKAPVLLGEAVVAQNSLDDLVRS